MKSNTDKTKSLMEAANRVTTEQYGDQAGGGMPPWPGGPYPPAQNPQRYNPWSNPYEGSPRPPKGLSGQGLYQWLLNFFIRMGIPLWLAAQMANNYMENNPIGEPIELNPMGTPSQPKPHEGTPPLGNPKLDPRA